jgi:argininosuccinate lyase
MLPHVKFRRQQMAQAAAGGFLNATDMADYLVSKGVPFREAHGVVGKAVSYALQQGKELDELSLEELRAFAGQVEADIYEHLTVESMIKRRRCKGGTAVETVRAALQTAGDRLSAAAEALELER